MTRILPLAHRRIAVTMQLLSHPLIFLTATGLDILPSLATLLGLLVFGLISAYLYRNTGLWQFGNAPDEQLDERQVQIRNQAYRFAYMGVSLLVILIFLYLFLADDFKLGVPRTYDQISPIFNTVLTFIMALPSAILAWTESDV